MADILTEQITPEMEVDYDDGGTEQTEMSIDEEANQKNEGEEKQSSSRLAQLPHTRVRNMMNLDHDLHIASQDSVFLVTKAAEYFIQFVAKEAHQKCVQSKRKTIQKKDLDSVILEVDSMAFLEGALE